MTHSLFERRNLAQILVMGVCSFSLVLPFALAGAAVGQEDAAEEDTSADAAQESKPRRVETPIADPLRVPTKDDWRDERRRRDEKTLFAPSPQEQRLRMELAKQFEQLKRQQEELMKERTRLEQEFRRAMAQFEQQKVPHTEAEARKQHAIAEAEAARAEMAALAAGQAQRNAPLPKVGTLKIFALKHSRAPETARVLSEILGSSPVRLAIDERTNTLLVFADKDIISTVESLVMNLDARPAGGTLTKVQPGETLQLRIVWLLDIDVGNEPVERFVSPHVIEALHELGFTIPKVVCQQVATLTLGKDNRQGRFHFQVPVLIKSQQWQFEGQGEVQPIADERFNLQFDLRFLQVRSDGETTGEAGQLGGSIHTPLGHYNVMGTTTFVAPERGAENSLQKQHLSAFVVYIDRAREFPAAGATSNQPDDERR